MTNADSSPPKITYSVRFLLEEGPGNSFKGATGYFDHNAWLSGRYQSLPDRSPRAPVRVCSEHDLAGNAGESHSPDSTTSLIKSANPRLLKYFDTSLMTESI